MRTRLSTVAELKEVFTETLLNNTNKVSKISDESVLNGIAFGVAKVGQKAIKEIALVESHILVDSAYGSQLDDVAESRGISPRLGSSGSSTFVRVVGDAGTTFTPGIHVFHSTTGESFSVDETCTIGINGFAYVKVRSVGSGRKTNVGPLTISRVTPEPVGYTYCINEYGAFGGRDEEDDMLFRERIKLGANLAATSTLAKLTQVFNKINNDVIRVFYHGTTTQGQTRLGVVTQNGVTLSPAEIDEIELEASEFLAVSDLSWPGTLTSGVKVENVGFQPIDVLFRVEISPSYSADDIRKEIQIEFSKYLDFRFWEYGQKVEWDELLHIVRTTRGVRAVPDIYFTPNSDVEIDVSKLPRIRSFQMMDLDGNLISDNGGQLNPVFYPINPDSSYQKTILFTI